MKRFINVFITIATTVAMTVSTWPAAAIAAELIPASTSESSTAAASAAGATASTAESSAATESSATQNSSKAEDATTADEAPAEETSTQESASGSDSTAAASASTNTDSTAKTTANNAAKDTGDNASSADASSASNANNTDDAPLKTAEFDAEDDFTLETWDEGISAATADGDKVSDTAQALLAKILAAYDTRSDSLTIDTSDNVTVADARAAMSLAYANAEYYWAKTSYGMGYYDADKDDSADDEEIVAGLYFRYYFSAADLPAAKQATEAKIDEALSWIDEDEMSAFEVTQALHDYLVRNCVYNLSANSATEPVIAHSAYGALVNGSAVCQGYALAYKLLLGRAGVPCVFVLSDSMNHAWNMVQIDGGWYHVDATWDDPVYSDGTDAGFDADVSHKYFLRADSTMEGTLSHYGWEAAYTTPASDYGNRSYAEYKGPVSTSGSGSGEESGKSPDGATEASSDGGTYAHSAEATQNGVTFKVEWNDPTTAGEATTFHVTQTGGSTNAKVRMDVPTYWDNGSQESVCDPSRSAWGNYTLVGDGYDFTFEFTASGTYRINFYFMDKDNSITYLRTVAEVTVDDAARPSVSQIVSDAVAQAKAATDGSEYAMALWLHDWTLDQLEYDYSLNWCSAESGLTRGKGTCESYQRIYAKLLDAAGIANGRVTGNGHTWNAVKIDGKWCQMDLTWDDSSDNWYGDFDQRHIYFGLTDELMAIAHSDHTATYQAEGYEHRSTDLSNNYFVRNGKADEWANAYAERIQEQLDAKKTEFSISADNASYPPGICGIQNGIIAATLNAREWTTADGTKATLVATSQVDVESSTNWTAVYNFTASYAKPTETKTSIAGASVTAPAQTYTGSALKPAPTVTLKGKILTQGTDYTVAYANNTNAGTATVTVTGKGSYTGSATSTFKISAADASKATVKAANQAYTGKALTPAPTVTFNGKALKQGTDYTLAYTNNTNAGTATVTVKFKGNYTGTASSKFTIAAANASKATVKVAAQTYTGKALTPAPTVTLNGKTLKQGADYTVAYTNNTNIGTGTATVTFKGNYTGSAKATFAINEKAAPTVAYQAHVQNIGWQSAVRNGATAGTSGQSLRVEAVKLWLENAQYSGGIQIRAHVQNIGWQNWSTTGGTSGRSLRVEAMQIRLTGELANHYDVYYRVHAQNFGWMGWAKNGNKAGSSGYSYRLEAVQIKIVKKGAAAPGSTSNAFRKPAMSVQYQAHVQNIGWQATVSNGATAGTSGRSLRVEALNVSIANGDYDGGIQIRTHVQNIGWQGWGSSGGTSGRGLRLEAMQLRLTGELANHYDVYYRVHAQNFGWMGWAKNGQSAGSSGYSYRLEAIQIRLVPKGGNAPGSTANCYRSR